jgi:hypothetical protein
MALQQKATVTTTKQIVLAPQVRKKLVTQLREFQSHKATYDAAKAAMNACKANIGKIRTATGESALEIEGFKISHVQQIRKVLNHKKLIAAGCAQAWIDEATENKPSKAYEKVTCPGEKDEEE